MKIRINGNTIKTEDIISIEPLVEHEFDDQIYFKFRVNLKYDDFITLLFKTHIYNGFIHTSYLPPDGPSESYWFKTVEFLKNLPCYKEPYERAKKMREDLEIIWDLPGQIFPIRDFNS